MSDPFKELSSLGQAHLISCVQTILGNSEELIQFFFHHKSPKLRVPTKVLIEESMKFHLRDQITIRVAIDFWNHRGAARLADMLTSWNNEDWLQFIEAIAKLREMQSEVFERFLELEWSPNENKVLRD